MDTHTNCTTADYVTRCSCQAGQVCGICDHASIDIAAQAASEDLSRAIHSYHLAASRPRTNKCWDFVQYWLWNARQVALNTGALVRDSQSYVFVSDRLKHAVMSASHTDAMERQGHVGYRSL